MAIELQVQNSDPILKKVNNLLTFIVVILGVYLILSPFLPQLMFWVKRGTGQINNTIPYSAPEDDTATSQPVPKDNRLIIPQMDLDDTVYEGKYASTLQKGIWHRPQTSTPDKGGNTVLVAHRFTYSSPATFYHLDKLKVDNELAVAWNGNLYTYRVKDVKVVSPNAVQIENNTPEPILTLYTCTPMWTAEKRLVVVSELIDGPII